MHENHIFLFVCVYVCICVCMYLRMSVVYMYACMNTSMIHARMIINNAYTSYMYAHAWQGRLH